MRDRAGTYRRSLRSLATILVTGAVLALPSAAAANHKYAGKWGTPGSGPGELSTPTGIDTDSLDNVYVADYGNNRIQKFSPDGELMAPVGNARQRRRPVQPALRRRRGRRRATCTSPTAATTASRSSTPAALVSKWGSLGSATGSSTSRAASRTDASGNVYVADSGNHRVQKFDSYGTTCSRGARPDSCGQFDYPPASTLPGGRIRVRQRLTATTACSSSTDRGSVPRRVRRRSRQRPVLRRRATSPCRRAAATFRGRQREQPRAAVRLTGAATSHSGRLARHGDVQLRRRQRHRDRVAGPVLRERCRANNRIQRFAAPISGSTVQGERHAADFRAPRRQRATRVTVSLSGGTYTVTDTARHAHAGRGCTPVTADQATCTPALSPRCASRSKDRQRHGHGHRHDPGDRHGRIGQRHVTGGAGVRRHGFTTRMRRPGHGESRNRRAAATGGAGSDTLTTSRALPGARQRHAHRRHAARTPSRVAAGIDRADYSSAPSGGDGGPLQQPRAERPAAPGPTTLSGIEDVTGSAFNDVLTGSSAVNSIRGGDGTDTVNPRRPRTPWTPTARTSLARTPARAEAALRARVAVADPAEAEAVVAP